LIWCAFEGIDKGVVFGSYFLQSEMTFVWMIFFRDSFDGVV